MRELKDLVERHEPAWPLVRSWIDAASNSVEVLPADPDKADVSLSRLQVTTRSPMGAIVHQTGGLLIDHGWLRVLGSGSPRLARSLPQWNAEVVPSVQGMPPPFLLIADDVLGGFFAVDGGGLTGSLGKVHYFAPDSLDWESLDASYSEFLEFAFSGDLETFYKSWRWPSWKEEIADLSGDRALTVYPFLFASGPAIAERARRPVPIAELWNLQQELRQQITQAG